MENRRLSRLTEHFHQGIEFKISLESNRILLSSAVACELAELSMRGEGRRVTSFKFESMRDRASSEAGKSCFHSMEFLNFRLSTSGPSSFRPSFPRDRRKRRPSSPIPKPLNERRRLRRIFLPSFLPSSSPLRAFHGSVKHRRESISQFSRPPTVP